MVCMDSMALLEILVASVADAAAIAPMPTAEAVCTKMLRQRVLASSGKCAAIRSMTGVNTA